jgi:hypothetical protein
MTKHLNEQSKRILTWLQKELEVVRSGEVAAKADSVIYHDYNGNEHKIEWSGRTEEFARGYKQGKEFALSIVDELLREEFPSLLD